MKRAFSFSCFYFYVHCSLYELLASSSYVRTVFSYSTNNCGDPEKTIPRIRGHTVLAEASKLAWSDNHEQICFLLLCECESCGVPAISIMLPPH